MKFTSIFFTASEYILSFIKINPTNKPVFIYK